MLKLSIKLGLVDDQTEYYFAFDRLVVEEKFTKEGPIRDRVTVLLIAFDVLW